MKKIICFVLSVLLLLTFSACSSKNTESIENSLDLEYYAKLGKIKECTHTLGEDIEELKQKLSQESSDESSNYSVNEGEKSVLIDNGSYLYYYMKGNESKGISYIVSFDTAYGFDIGTVSIGITDALSGIKYTEENVTDENAFFLSDSSNGNIIRYTFDNINVLFVFQDNGLCATVIYDSNNWTL